MVVLEARSVSVSLGGNQILNGIDLDVKSGSWVSIVGPNGAGKTTAMRMLCGLSMPTSPKSKCRKGRRSLKANLSGGAAMPWKAPGCILKCGKTVKNRIPNRG